jgi:type I restriction enzyme S subunit
MAGEWKDITLGDFVILQRGHDLTEPERRPGHVPVIGSAGQNGFHDTALAKGPGIVIGRSGASFGQVHFCANDYWPHNTGLYVIDFKRNDPRFAYYFLKALDFDRYNSGSAQPSLNRNFIYPIPICVPELDEQKTIAKILGTLDDKIELNRRMNATLEAMARVLFQSWFVDFDPVRAKLDGRKPAGLDAATAALFPAHFQDSTLGHIPQGWEVKPMSEVIEVNPRRTLKSGAISPYLDMKNMPTQGHAVDEVILREFSSGTKFQNGDTLLARITPCLENGKSAFVDFLEDGQVGWGSTEYIVFAPKPPLTPEFGYYLARSDALRLHAIQNMTGTSGRQRVPSDCFTQFKLAVPPAKIAQRFGEITKPWMTKIHANIEQSLTLATLRDALLPKLLSGDIRVANIEEEVASV